MVPNLYLLLCVLGTVLPYSQCIRFITEHGMDLPLFFNQIFQTPGSSFFGLDVIVSSLVLWVFIFTEVRRRQMKHLWVYVVCNLTVGVSLGLPLFLYMRERQR